MNDLQRVEAGADVAFAEPVDLVETEIVFDQSKFEVVEKVANIMADGKVTVPAHLRGNKGDCFAVTLQAMMWKMNPFAVAQKTHLVNGTLGYEAQLVNAAVTNSRAIVGFFNYDFRGDGAALACRVGAVLRGSSEITWGEFLCISDVTTKNSPLWKTNPRQQLGYLQVKNWARLYTPGAMLGVYSVDELEDGGVINAAPRYAAPRQIEAPATPPPPRQEPPPPAGDAISEPQRKRLYAISKGRGLTDEEAAFIVFDKSGVNSSKDIPRDKYEAVCAAIEAAEPGKVIDA